MPLGFKMTVDFLLSESKGCNGLPDLFHSQQLLVGHQNRGFDELHVHRRLSAVAKPRYLSEKVSLFEYIADLRDMPYRIGDASFELETVL